MMEDNDWTYYPVFSDREFLAPSPPSPSPSKPGSSETISREHIIEGRNFIKSTEGLKQRIEHGQCTKAFALFGPISMMELMTKTQYLMCNDTRGELQSVHNQLAKFPFENMKKKENAELISTG